MRLDVAQRQINVETTLCASVNGFTMLNNIEPRLSISTLISTTLDNVETILSLSTSMFKPSHFVKCQLVFNFTGRLVQAH